MELGGRLTRENIYFYLRIVGSRQCIVSFIEQYGTLDGSKVENDNFLVILEKVSGWAYFVSMLWMARRQQEGPFSK